MNRYGTAQSVLERDLFLLLVLLIALAGCGSEAPSERLLAGNWEIEERGMAGTLSLRPDGSYLADTNEGTLSGTWKIKGDRLTGTVTKSTVPNVPTGSSWTNVIAHVSENKLVLQARSGDTEQYHRVR